MMPRLGPTGGWYLKLFGDHVERAFGHVPYHVGSSLTADTFRDVDVRLILPDSEMEGLFGKPTAMAKLRVWNLAWSALGAQMTGLPIDFQFQKETPANALEDGPRSALLVHASELPTFASGEPTPDADDQFRYAALIVAESLRGKIRSQDVLEAAVDHVLEHGPEGDATQVSL